MMPSSRCDDSWAKPRRGPVQIETIARFASRACRTTAVELLSYSCVVQDAFVDFLSDKFKEITTSGGTMNKDTSKVESHIVLLLFLAVVKLCSFFPMYFVSVWVYFSLWRTSSAALCTCRHMWKAMPTKLWMRYLCMHCIIIQKGILDWLHTLFWGELIAGTMWYSSVCRFAHVLEDRPMEFFPPIHNSNFSGVGASDQVSGSERRQLLTGISAWDSAR